MLHDNSPVTDDELHAYVDGELPADRQEAVAAWLVAHPDDAEKVAAWRAQAEAIRARYQGVAQEPVPDRLKLDQITRRHLSPRSWMAIASAAAVAAFLIGGASGWMARGAAAASPSGFEVFTDDALTAHKLYIAEMRHPIEVKAGESHLVPWLSRRVGTELRPPDLSRLGLKLMGGRLLPGPNGPAALFMYEGGSGERYTIYAARTSAPETAFRYKGENRDAAMYWVFNQVGYVVSGPANRDRLQSVASAAYEQSEQQPKG